MSNDDSRTPDALKTAGAGESPAPGAENAADSSASTKARRVLLVEDEPLIRMNSADMLMDLGFDVAEAGSVQEALAVLSGGTIEVLIADVGLPDGSGLDLAVEALTRQPSLKVVFATGHATVEGADERVPAYKLLPKPYDMSNLKEVLA